MLLVLVLAISIIALCPFEIIHADKDFKYVFRVDDEGFTNVTVYFHDDRSGSSWILVPKDQAGDIGIRVFEGFLLNVSYQKLVEGGEENPFYVVMRFSYNTDRGVVNISISYLMPYGGLIIEPKAIFISPRITHEKTGYTKTITILPGYVTTDEDMVSSFSGFAHNVRVSRSNHSVMVEAYVGSDDRVVIEYLVPFQGNVTSITAGSFIFKTPARYQSFARDILLTLNSSYTTYKELFNVDLKSVEVQFFVPSIKDIFAGLEGYVPFEGGKLGAIHLNILYIRGVEGFMDIIALHELTHHFLWAIGVPPSKLWIHEGIAEYLSLNMGRRLGYLKAVDMHERDLKYAWRFLNEDLGFIQRWTPFYVPPQGLKLCYAASYYVIKHLCDEYGGLNYLKALFREFKHVDWGNETQVIEAFGVAANDVEGVFELFERWGFEVSVPPKASLIIAQVKRSISIMPSWLEPYRSFIEIAIRIAESLEQFNAPYSAILVGRLAQFLCLISPYLFAVSLIVVLVGLLALRKR